LADQGTYFSNYAKPLTNQATGYFSALAGGDRAKMTQTLAPDIENVNSVYGGTGRTLRRFLRGPDRDLSLGDLERERAGQVASLFRNNRFAANTTLSSMAGNAIDTSLRANAGAGSLFGGVAGQQASSRLAGADINRQAGADTGNLIFQLLKSYATKGGPSSGGGNSGILGSSQTVPSSTSWMPG
jgi:hypothetical protein